MAFYRPASDERVLGLWARRGTSETAYIPALAGEASLIERDGTTTTLTPTDGVYTLTLPAATNQNAFWDPSLYAIGGQPYIVVEQDAQAPTASLDLPDVTIKETLLVRWSGNDGLGGGVAAYDVEVAVNGGAAEAWLTGTTATQAGYEMSPGNRYTFTVRARDRAGNVSASASRTVEALDPSAFTERSYLPFAAR